MGRKKNSKKRKARVKGRKGGEDSNDVFETRKVPPDIKFEDSVVFGLDFNPTKNILACGLITGQICLFEYGLETKCRELMNVNAHKESCRAVLFSHDGSHILSGGSDMSVQYMNVEDVKSVSKYAGHSAPISSIAFHPKGELFVSGDDDGYLKLWDVRSSEKPVSTWEEHNDYLSSLKFHPDSNSIVATSGDGNCSVYNLRNNEVEVFSHFVDNEILCSCLMNKNSEVLFGSQSGIIFRYSWGEWDELNDVLPGHPDAVNSMIQVDDTTLISGSADGLIRVVDVDKGNVIGVIGQLDDGIDDDDTGSFEKLILDYQNHFLASSHHDNVVKFWDVSFVYHDDINDNDDNDDAAAISISVDNNETGKSKNIRRRSSKKVSYVLPSTRLQKKAKKQNDFFADL